MVNLRIKHLTGSLYHKYFKEPLVPENIIRAEANTLKLSNEPKDGTLVINNQCVSQFMMEQGLVDVVKTGNLIVSEVYADNKFEDEFILAKKNTLVRIANDEYAEFERIVDFSYWKWMLQMRLVDTMRVTEVITEKEKVEEDVLDDENQPTGKKKIVEVEVKKSVVVTKTFNDVKNEPLQEVPLLDLDEWTSFWKKVNDYCRSNSVVLTTITKTPVTLHEIGGICSNRYDTNKRNLAIVNPNSNNAWELSYVWGYSNEALYNLLGNVKDRSDLELISYFER